MLNLDLLFRTWGNRKDRPKPEAQRTLLALEGLEDRTVLSAMHGLPIPTLAAPDANIHINEHFNIHEN